MEPEFSLPHSQAPANCSYPEPQPQSQSVETEASFPMLCCQKIRPNLSPSKPRPTPKLEDYPLSTLRDCLLSIFAATLHIWWPLLHLRPEDAPRCGDNETLTLSQTCLLRATVNQRTAAPPCLVKTLNPPPPPPKNPRK
jgi:hypothetical protein